MPKGTRVHRCVDKVKKQGKDEGNAIAICQASTKQSFATGKTTRKSDHKPIDSPHESLDQELLSTLHEVQQAMGITENRQRQQRRQQIDPVRQVAALMENMVMGGPSVQGQGGGFSGDAGFSAIMTSMPGDSPMSGTETDEGSDAFGEDELKITKRFVDLIGSVERARELLDKVGECEECLGLIDDDEADEITIQQIGDATPDILDLPTSRM